MTDLWSVTQWAFASCAPMLTTLDHGTGASKTIMEELPQTPMMMESDHGKLDSPVVCEEGIEMELDKPPYHSNTMMREDAHFHGMIDATKGNDINDSTKPGNLVPVEDLTLTHGKGVVDNATTVEAELPSNPMTLKKKISLLFKLRWSRRSDPRRVQSKGQMMSPDIGEVPEATIVSSSEESSTDYTKEKKGSVDPTFDSHEKNCIDIVEDSGMVTGENKPLAGDLGKKSEDDTRATKPYPGHVVLKQNQQKSRTHVRDDVSTLSSSTGGDGSSKNTESCTVDTLSKERNCGSLAQVDKLSTVPEKDGRDDKYLEENNDTLPLKIDKLIDNGDNKMPQLTKHLAASSIQNTIVVKDVSNVMKDAKVSLQNDPTNICEPSLTVKSIDAMPQGSTLGKIPICQYDVALMKPLFEPEDDDSDDEDDVSQGVGILKMVSKQTLAKDCFRMDMNEPDLWRYSFNNCHQGTKTQDATAHLNQDQHVTNPSPSSSTIPLDNTTNMDTVEISFAENDENRGISKKGFFGRFRTRRRQRPAPSRETVQYNVSPGDYIPQPVMNDMRSTGSTQYHNDKNALVV